MINPRFVSIYGFVGLLVMLVLLGLVFFRQVPDTYYLPFCIIAVVLFAGRMILRVLVARQERQAKRLDQSEEKVSEAEQQPK